MERAFDSTREVTAAAVNFVFAEPEHIGWQVSGRYPNRREGQGLLPSPGWDGRYDWDGYADPMLHPYDQDPPAGWIGHANQRSLPRGYGMQLSSTWYYPERAERLAQLAGNGRHDSRSLMALQNDQVTLLANKLKQMFDAPGMAQPLKQAIDALPAGQRDKARDTLARLKAFDGRLSPVSADAALYELFLQEVARQTFLDDLGPEAGPAWQAFVSNARLSFSAQADHLLGRDDSPFWDDRNTPQKKTSPPSSPAAWRAQWRPGSRSWVPTDAPGSGASCTSTAGRHRPTMAWGCDQPCAACRRRRLHYPGPHTIRLGQRLRHASASLGTDDRRLRPGRTVADTDQQRPVRQPGQRALPRRAGCLVQRALHEPATATAELRQGVWQPAAYIGTGAVTAFFRGA